MRRLIPFSVIAALLILLFSCSGSPPVIINTEWMVVYTKDFSRGGVFSELNFFAQIDDNDGLEDIIEMSVHKDDLGWSWNLNPDNWAGYTADGEYWVGSSGLTRGESIPFGEYRLLIVDRSGQRNETKFKVGNPGIIPESIVFPELKVLGDKLWISTGNREPVVLWFYNDKAILVTEKYTGPGVFGIDELISPEEKQIARWVMIYYQDEAGGYGLKSGPFLLIPEESRNISDDPETESADTAEPQS